MAERDIRQSQIHRGAGNNGDFGWISKGLSIIKLKALKWRGIKY